MTGREVGTAASRGHGGRRVAGRCLVAMVACCALAALSGAPPAHALRAALPMRLALLRARGGQSPDPFPEAVSAGAAIPTIAPDGALVVTARVAPRPGNRDPRAVRLRDARGPVRTVVEELAPGLYRIAPRGRLRPGTLEVAGLDIRRARVARVGPAPAAPSIASVTRRSVPVDPAQPTGLSRTSVTVSMAAPAPPGVIAIVARWVDWHDAEGGLYGAWATITPEAAGDVILICEPDECGDVYGHVPRENERGELRFIDASGRLSPATTLTVATAR